MWKNIVQPEGIRMTKRRMIFAQSEYVTLIGFPLQQWLHECISVLRYIILFVLFIVKLHDT